MILFYLALIILAGLFALFHIFKTKDKFARIINITFVASIGITFVQVKEIAIDGYYLFAIGCLMVVLYAFSDGSFSDLKKGVLITGGGIQLAGVLFFLGQYPFQQMAYLAGFITMILFFTVVTKNIKNYSNEIGFLAVLMADAVIKVTTVLISYLA